MLEQDFISKKPDWKFLDSILSAIVVKDQKNATDTDLMTVVRTVYERTYYRYALKWYEEKMLREKYENRIVEMRLEIEQLKRKVEDGVDTENIEQPVQAGTTEDAKVILFPTKGGDDDGPSVA